MTTVLLLGSQTEFLHDLTEILEYEGFETLIANCVDDALQLAANHRPNVIVYDVTTSILANTLVADLAVIEPVGEIPLLFLTNVDSHELPDESYLLKPFPMGNLFRRLEQLLNQWQDPPIYQPA